MEVALVKDVSCYVPSFGPMKLQILLEPLNFRIYLIKYYILIKDLSRYVFESPLENKHLKLLFQVPTLIRLCIHDNDNDIY